uniref:Uncharacterized protein n=1 Tax=Moniliophthora roreri TaxID=221103 RepID=A0A0W0G5B8_MONRR
MKNFLDSMISAPPPVPNYLGCSPIAPNDNPSIFWSLFLIYDTGRVFIYIYYRSLHFALYDHLIGLSEERSALIPESYLCKWRALSHIHLPANASLHPYPSSGDRQLVQESRPQLTSSLRRSYRRGPNFK